MTGHSADRRLIVALNAETGAGLWTHTVVAARRERYSPLNGPASPTAVSDVENVYAFFPDTGLISCTRDGKERWRVPLGPFMSEHGMAASPILVEDRIVLLADQIDNSYMAAYNAADGSLSWKIARPDVMGGYSTPAVFAAADGKGFEIITSGPYEAAAYSAATGAKLWWVRGLGQQAKTIPVIGPDIIYAVATGGPETATPAFPELVRALDRNGDGEISYAEVPDPGIRKRFVLADTGSGNGDGKVDAGEYERDKESLVSGGVLLALRPGGAGDLTRTNVIWKLNRSLPEVPSPLLYDEVLYLVRDGGIVTALDPKTGGVFKQDRLRKAVDNYYASPVAGDGKVYIVGEKGRLTVLRAGAQWEVLATNDLDGNCYATPAIAGNRLYVRVGSILYCFSASQH